MSNVILRHYLVLWLVLNVFAISLASFSVASQNEMGRPAQNSRTMKSVVYSNKKYGFRFSLPESWKGYSINVSQWEGGDGRTYQPGEVMPPPKKGPLITIHHPLSTDSNPRQDIIIMVFTKAQWKLVEEDKIILSAAPVGPNELGRNAKFVFALPPRFNGAGIEGWQEVDEIIQNHPLHAF
jgi:hypothetical protein